VFRLGYQHLAAIHSKRLASSWLSSSSNTTDMLVAAVDQLDAAISKAGAAEAAMASADDVATQQQEPATALQPLLQLVTAALLSLQAVDEVRMCSCCFVGTFVKLPLCERCIYVNVSNTTTAKLR